MGTLCREVMVFSIFSIFQIQLFPVAFGSANTRNILKLESDRGYSTICNRNHRHQIWASCNEIAVSGEDQLFEISEAGEPLWSTDASAHLYK